MTTGDAGGQDRMTTADGEGGRATTDDGGWREVCASDALLDGGDGVRFEVRVAGVTEPAFVVRFDGAPRAYLNRCRHIPVELDWLPGRFFDDAGLYLICATHGATYQADDGLCIAGPCRGRSLIAIPVRERDGSVWAAVEFGNS